MRHPFCKLCEKLHHSECLRDDIGLNPACAKILMHGHYPLNLGESAQSLQCCHSLQQFVEPLHSMTYIPHPVHSEFSAFFLIAFGQ
jgi:hypothetical protein